MSRFSPTVATAVLIAITSFGQDGAGRLFATDVTDGTVYRARLTGPRP